MSKVSVLRKIMEDVYAANTFDDGIAIVKSHLTSAECPIRKSEGAMIIQKATECISLASLQQYITNSWFKYEGLGLK